MAEDAVARLRVNLLGSPDVSRGWFNSCEISIRDDAHTAFTSLGYVADARSSIHFGRHDPGGERGIRWSTPLRYREFAHVITKVFKTIPLASPIEVHANSAARREAYTAAGVFFELADYLEDEVGDDVVESVHLTLGDQLIRWSDNPEYFLPRVEVRSLRVGPSVVWPLLGATACNSLAPQFETAAHTLATI